MDGGQADQGAVSFFDLEHLTPHGRGGKGGGQAQAADKDWLQAQHAAQTLQHCYPHPRPLPRPRPRHRCSCSPAARRLVDECFAAIAVAVVEVPGDNRGKCAFLFSVQLNSDHVSPLCLNATKANASLAQVPPLMSTPVQKYESSNIYVRGGLGGRAPFHTVVWISRPP